MLIQTQTGSASRQAYNSCRNNCSNNLENVGKILIGSYDEVNVFSLPGLGINIISDIFN